MESVTTRRFCRPSQIFIAGQLSDQSLSSMSEKIESFIAETDVFSSLPPYKNNGGSHALDITRHAHALEHLLKEIRQVLKNHQVERQEWMHLQHGIQEFKSQTQN